MLLLGATALTAIVPTGVRADDLWVFQGVNGEGWRTQGNWTNGVAADLSDQMPTPGWPGSLQDNRVVINNDRTVRLTGDADVIAANTVYAGYGTSGALVVSSGASLETQNAYAGHDATGTVTISGSGTLWRNYGGTNIGTGGGNGTLNILNGGELRAGAFYVAGGSGTGLVRVEGLGSKLTANMFVGNGGHVMILDGATALTTTPSIGWGDDSRAEVLVSDAGTAWTIGEFLSVGSSAGSHGVVTLQNGGAATINGIQGAFLGLYQPHINNVGVAGTINIGAAAGETAAAPGNLTAARILAGTNGTLVFNHTEQNGYAFNTPLVSNALGDGRIEHLAGSTTLAGDSATFSGTTHLQGGTLTVTNRLNGTLDLAGGTLRIAGGGIVASRGASIANISGAQADIVVEGAGSSWNVVALPSHLTLGDEGTARVTLRDGGALVTSQSQTNGAILLGSSNQGGNARIAIGAQVGETAAAPGTIAAGNLIFQSGDPGLVFNHTSDNYSFSTRLTSGGLPGSWAGHAILHEAGVTNLNSNAFDFQGSTTISGGTLNVNGALGGSVVVAGGALGGSGRLLGSLDVQAGALNPGNSPGVLTIDGNLLLSSQSVLNFELGSPSGTPGIDSDLIEVGGDLTLDGTLNVIDAGGFGEGLYRLFNYGGALTDNGLEIGAVPTGFDPGDLAIQAAMAGQVNLAVGATVSPPAGFYNYWDGQDGFGNGVVGGGSGTWSTGGTNWTNADGSENGPYDSSSLLIFAGAGGTVTVDRGASAALDVGYGMQFFSDGYRITGDGLGLDAPDTIIRVGDGSAAGADYTATIASSLSGGGFVKTDLGSLVLSGDGSLSGTARITNGVVHVWGRLESGLDIPQGELRVAFGGVVTANALDFGNTPSALGAGITVDGLGSLLDLTGLPTNSPLVIAENLSMSETTLTVRNGGVFRAPSHAIISGSEEAPGLSTIVIGSAIGEELAAPGTIETPLLRTETGRSRLIFNHASDGYDFAPGIGTRSDLGGTTEIQHEAGVTNLLGDAGGVIGVVNINGGTLNVQNRLGGTVNVNGGTLSGTGQLTGMVYVGAGEVSPGTSPGILTFGESLVLSSNSLLSFELGSPGGTPGVDSDLINVAGDLTLDGTLNVIDAGGFGDGLYRLINYGGALTDNGLDIGATPSGYGAGDLTVQTATSGQVNLLVGQVVTPPPASYNFWDGASTGANNLVDGGTGTWSLAGTNWTNADGSANGPYDPASLLIFAGTGGTVAIDAGSAGSLEIGPGMQFASDGYVLTGDGLFLGAPDTAFRIGDGTSAGAGHVATIASSLSGGGFNKTDLGRLVLSGDSSLIGTAQVSNGVLEVQGRLESGLSILQGELRITGGGVIAGNQFLFGYAPTALDTAITIDGAGSLLDLTGLPGNAPLRIAENLGQSEATLVVRNGGVVRTPSTHAIISGSEEAPGLSTIVIGAAIGEAPTAPGTIETPLLRTETGRSRLIFNHTSNAYDFAPDISTRADLGGTTEIYHEAGVTNLLGDAGGLIGVVNINGGTLNVQNRLDGTVNVNGGTLGGGGQLTGTVTVGDARLSPGNSPGVLSFGGNLILSGASVLDFELGAPGGTPGVDSDLINVAGDLTLDGTLNAIDAGGFGDGLYRLFNYGGALTDNGLSIGATPSGYGFGDLTVQTATAGQVNLLVASMPTPSGSYHFWDGSGTTANGIVEGGPGVWSLTGTNWTTADGSANGVHDPAQLLIFSGTGGTVTVDAPSATLAIGPGMQFASDGYSVTGGGLTLNEPAATIRVGDGTAAGAAYTATIASSLDGASRLAKDDLGTLILAGANSYSGGTAIDAGTLVVGNGGTSGSIVGPVLNEGTLAFNRADDVSFAGVIAGTGALRQAGTGKTELTGNSNAFAGSTFVERGALAVNGTLGGALDVLAAGRLQGSGTVGDTIVRGTIAPGNSIGTLNVAGNIGFAAGSVYEVEANAQGQADRIAASGTAAIQGGTVRVLAGAGTYQPRTDYTILTAAGGVSGSFASVTSNLAFLDPTLSYDARNVYLRLQRNDVSFAGIGVTPNQIATGGATERLGWNNAVFEAAVNLSAAQARDAFDQLSGEIHPSARTAMLEDSRFVRNAMRDRLRAGSGEAGGGVWGQAIGSWGHTGGDGNAARLDRSTGGLLMGIDGANDTIRLGAVWGYSRTDIDVKARGSSGTIDSYHLGANAGGQWGDFSVRTGIAYAWHDVHTVRNIAFAGYGDTLRASYAGHTLQAFGELAYGLDLGGAGLEPYANLAYVRASGDAFAETGGDAKLAGAKTSTDVTFTNLGLRTTAGFDLGKANATLRAGAGWRHAFGDTAPVTATRYQAGGTPFAIGGLPFARDAATLDAGLDIAISDRASIGIGYSGQIGDRLADHSARASIDFRF